MHWIDPDCLPQLSARFERFFAQCAWRHRRHHVSAVLRGTIRADENPKLITRGIWPRRADAVGAVTIQTTDHKRIVDDGKVERPPPGSRNMGRCDVRAQSGATCTDRRVRYGTRSPAFWPLTALVRSQACHSLRRVEIRYWRVDLSTRGYSFSSTAASAQDQEADAEAPGGEVAGSRAL